jgi:deoxyadenosine/deoxycytidine kinase
MTSLEELEKRISQIESRNRKVEQDKEWETSYTRRVILIIFTYLSIGIYLQALNIENAWANAIVPSLAFWLSTLTLPYFKRFWERYIHKK